MCQLHGSTPVRTWMTVFYSVFTLKDTDFQHTQSQHRETQRFLGDNAGTDHPCSSWNTFSNQEHVTHYILGKLMHKNEEGMLSLRRKQRIVLVVSDKVRDLKLLSDLGKQTSLPYA